MQRPLKNKNKNRFNFWVSTGLLESQVSEVSGKYVFRDRKLLKNIGFLLLSAGFFFSIFAF